MNAERSARSNPECARQSLSTDLACRGRSRPDIDCPPREPASDGLSAAAHSSPPSGGAACRAWLGLAAIVASLVLPTTSRARADDQDGDGTPVTQATPDAEWDAAFSRSEGWTGGDVAGTVDLGDGRTLWMFGDSWIGKVSDGRHAPDARLINNSIAIQTQPAARRGQTPAPADLQFYWGPGDDQQHPTPWLVPAAHAAGQESSTDDANHLHGWYWCTGGGAVVGGPDARPRLIVFLFQVGKQQGETGVWAFKSIGGALATIDDLSQPVDKWQPRQVRIPHVVDTDAAKANSRLRETSWGVAALRQADSDGKQWLYVYGIRNESPLDRQLLVARVAEHSVDQFDAWRFYAGQQNWTADAAAAVPIARNLTNELSVEPVKIGDRPALIMVHSEALFGRRIFLRSAVAPQGPWTEPAEIYSVDEIDRQRSYFTYAAKGHWQLSRPHELLVTYVVNAHDFGEMAADARIYRPRFVRVPLEKYLPRAAAGHGPAGE
jgi:hypothetical protein